GFRAGSRFAFPQPSSKANDIATSQTNPTCRLVIAPTNNLPALAAKNAPEDQAAEVLMQHADRAIAEYDVGATFMKCVGVESVVAVDRARPNARCYDRLGVVEKRSQPHRLIAGPAAVEIERRIGLADPIALNPVTRAGDAFADHDRVRGSIGHHGLPGLT